MLHPFCEKFDFIMLCTGTRTENSYILYVHVITLGIHVLHVHVHACRLHTWIMYYNKYATCTYIPEKMKDPPSPSKVEEDTCIIEVDKEPSTLVTENTQDLLKETSGGNKEGVCDCDTCSTCRIVCEGLL